MRLAIVPRGMDASIRAAARARIEAGDHRLSWYEQVVCTREATDSDRMLNPVMSILGEDGEIGDLHGPEPIPPESDWPSVAFSTLDGSVLAENDGDPEIRAEMTRILWRWVLEQAK